MARKSLEEFLKTGVLARRAGVNARVVVRRFEANATALDRAADDGSVTVSGVPVCELVVGETVLARGEIVEADGQHVFQVKEVVG